MNRASLFRIGTNAVATMTFLVASISTLSSQQLPIAHGSTVRVSRADSSGEAFWSTGRVVFASRDQLLLAETEDDPLVVYNEALSLHVRRGERAMTGVGGGIGFGVGALLGMLSQRSARAGDPDKPSLAPAIVGGAVGGLLGAIIGSRIRIPRWEEVPIEGGHIAIAPLDESGTNTGFSLNRAVRWTRFAPTGADFQAFFEAHANDLHPIEGIWVRTGTHFGVAIVRVAERDQTFAAYRIRPDVGAGHPSSDGLMLFALTPTAHDETDWRFQVARTSPRQYTARVEFDILRLEYPSGAVDQWEKWYP